MTSQIRPIRSMILTAALALAGVFALAPQSASADEGQIREYQRGVDQLVIATDAWSAEVEDLLSAARSKPEMVCGPELSALVRRGQGLVSDFQGTGTLAPGMLRERHDAATAELADAAATLQALVDQCQTASLDDMTRAFGSEMAAYDKALRPVRYFAARGR